MTSRRARLCCVDLHPTAKGMIDANTEAQEYRCRRDQAGHKYRPADAPNASADDNDNDTKDAGESSMIKDLNNTCGP
jgi:hypothetical protein